MTNVDLKKVAFVGAQDWERGEVGVVVEIGVHNFGG